MKRLLIVFTAILLLGILLPTHGQELIGARSMGMAFSNIAVTEGLEHINGNPATLAIQRDFNFEMNLISTRAMVKNNGLTLGLYEKYFTTGDTLSGNDINDLLSHIPEEGLKANFDAGFLPISFYSRYFSISLSGISNANFTIPKEPLEIPFRGISSNSNYSLEGMEGEAWAAAAASFSLAIPMSRLTEPLFDTFAIGVSLKYLKGFNYGKILRATGGIFTSDEYILANGTIEALHSNGGTGMGLDLGLIALRGEKWTFSLNVNNLIGQINWNQNNEIIYYHFAADTINFNSLEGFQTNEVDTSYATGGFTTPLPRTLYAAIAFQPGSKLLLTGAIRQGLNTSLGNYTRPLVALGAEIKVIPLLPLRMGFNVGGNNGFSLGMGFGIDLKYWQLNVGYLNHNMKWMKQSESIELAVTSSLRF